MSLAEDKVSRLLPHKNVAPAFAIRLWHHGSRDQSRLHILPLVSWDELEFVVDLDSLRFLTLVDEYNVGGKGRRGLHLVAGNDRLGLSWVVVHEGAVAVVTASTNKATSHGIAHSRGLEGEWNHWSVGQDVVVVYDLLIHGAAIGGVGQVDLSFENCTFATQLSSSYPDCLAVAHAFDCSTACGQVEGCE